MPKISRSRRREMEEQAKQVRLRGQLEGWSADHIVARILEQLPELLPLEAYRFAHGWTREQLSAAIDLVYERDGLKAPRISPAEICGWEHGRHRPNAERQDVLACVYRTRPDRLGFGQDHTRGSGGPPLEGPSPAPGVTPVSEVMVEPLRTDGATSLTILVDTTDGTRSGLTISVGREAWAFPVEMRPADIAAGDPMNDPLLGPPGRGALGLPPPGMGIEGEDMDRRTVIKLLGGFAAAGLVPTLEVDPRVVEMAGAAGGQRVDSSLVESLRVITGAYAGQRRVMGPSVVLQPVRSHLRYLKALLAGTGSEAVRADLASVAGETAVLAGFCCFHVQNLGEARVHYTFAREVAHEFGNRVLAAVALIAESMLHLTTAFASQQRDGVQALKLLDQAAHFEPALPHQTRAWLAAQQAEVHATLRHVDQCHRALDRSRQAATEAGRMGEDQPLSLWPWSESSVDGYDGICSLLLDDARRAAAMLERRLNAVDPAEATSAVISWADLGAAYVRQGELEEGARAVARAFDGAAAVGHALGIQRVRAVRNAMEPWKHEPAVRQLDERLNR
jgi:transcriptional regulator with XRE-family HTH domain